MGAWDAGIFDDDSSCDLLADFQEASDVPELMREAFDAALGTDYLEYDACHAVIVSGAVLDAVLNPAVDTSSYPEEFGEVVTKVPAEQVTALKPQAVQALKRVIAEGSELNELWVENEELYPTWKGNIEALITRLG